MAVKKQIRNDDRDNNAEDCRKHLKPEVCFGKKPESDGDDTGDDAEYNGNDTQYVEEFCYSLQLAANVFIHFLHLYHLSFPLT